MQLAAIHTHKRGDSFEADCVYRDENGAAATIVGITITSQIRTSKDVLIADCVVTRVDEEAGAFRLTVANTTAWPVQMLEWDIRYSYDETAISTEVVGLQIIRGVTRP